MFLLHKFSLKEKSRSITLKVMEDGLKRLLGLPCRVLRRKRLYPIDDKEELKIHRLFTPESAVVVEGGNALLRNHKVLTAGLGHAVYEVDYGSFSASFIPGRKWIA